MTTMSYVDLRLGKVLSDERVAKARAISLKRAQRSSDQRRKPRPIAVTKADRRDSKAA
jgi:hypothetical protein